MAIHGERNMNELIVTSPAFENEGLIPIEYIVSLQMYGHADETHESLNEISSNYILEIIKNLEIREA